MSGFVTERLLVRQASLDDAATLLAIFGDAETMRLFRDGVPFTATDVRELLIDAYPAGDPSLVSAPGLVRRRSDDQPAGYGGVGYYASETAGPPELLFVIARAHCGQGYATELARGAIADAFDQPRIAGIVATAHPANAASIRVLEKAGMARIGRDSAKNRVRFAITRPGWSPHRDRSAK